MQERNVYGSSRLTSGLFPHAPELHAHILVLLQQMAHELLQVAVFLLKQLEPLENLAILVFR